MHTTTVSGNNDENFPEEDKVLLLSADIQYATANRLCDEVLDKTSGMASSDQQDSCKWYHAPWQYCRITQGIPSPELHKTIYEDVFSDLFFRNERKILICGTADYAILLHLLKSIHPKYFNKVEITILDLCNSPLEICKWFQNFYQEKTKNKIEIRYVQGDAIQSEFQNVYFDIITCYSFLSRFAPDQRVLLLNEWNRILKDNGIIITSDRISPEYGDGKILPTPDQVKYFVDKVSSNIDTVLPSLNINRDKLTELSYQYARNIISYSFPSEKYFCELFKGYNCSIESCQTPGELEFPETYAWIKAVKTQI